MKIQIVVWQQELYYCYTENNIINGPEKQYKSIKNEIKIGKFNFLCRQIQKNVV